jgi:phosphoglycolate phosphatase
MPYTLVIFDLDGTLADSFPWFLRNVNGVADRFGFHRIAAQDIEHLRRVGSRDILKRQNVPLWKLPMIARHMRRLKTAHLDDIPLFPGVDTLLDALAAKGVAAAMVSSDSEDNVRRALGARNASAIAHYACGASMFGKAAKFKRVLSMAGVPPRQAIAIGDEIRDLEAARRAGIAFGAVSWGYASPRALAAHAPDAMFTSMDDIVRFLG